MSTNDDETFEAEIASTLKGREPKEPVKIPEDLAAITSVMTALKKGVVNRQGIQT